MGSCSRITGVVCHSLLQWTKFYQNSSLWSVHLGWPCMHDLKSHWVTQAPLPWQDCDPWRDFPYLLILFYLFLQFKSLCLFDWCPWKSTCLNFSHLVGYLEICSSSILLFDQLSCSPSLSLWLLPKYRSHAGLFLVIIHYWRAPIHLGEPFTTEWCWKGQRAEEWAGWRLQFGCIVSQCLLSSYAASSA